MKEKMKFNIYYLFYLIPVVVMAYLLWQNIKPVLEVKCNILGKTRLWPVRGDIFYASNGLCGELVPTARVNKTKNDAFILEEPVYFDVKLPRKYDTVEAEIKYSNLKTDIFEFGVAQDVAKKSFDFSAMENKILDNISWKKISAQGGSALGGEQDGLVLYQKNPVYKNITDFISNPPKFSETLVYRADLAPKFGIMSAKGNAIIDFPVRETIKLLVYKAGAAPQVIVDADSDFHKTIDNLGGGLYAINLAGSEEMIFKKISIDSPYVAIANKIKIGHLQKPAMIYFAGSRLLANAYEAGGAQVIDANGQIINIERVQEQYVSVFKNIKLRPVEIPKGEVELGASLFFISDKNIFYPRYEAFYSGADLSKVNFILAKYTPPGTVIASLSEGAAISSFSNGIASSGTPRNDKLVKSVRAIFNIADTPTPDRKLRFIISLPNAAKGELVNIKSIELKFTGEKFSFAEIIEKFFNFRNPLPLR